MTSIGREKFEKRKTQKKIRKIKISRGLFTRLFEENEYSCNTGRMRKKHNISELTRSAIFAAAHSDGEQVEVPRPEKNWKK